MIQVKLFAVLILVFGRWGGTGQAQDTPPSSATVVKIQIEGEEEFPQDVIAYLETQLQTHNITIETGNYADSSEYFVTLYGPDPFFYGAATFSVFVEGPMPMQLPQSPLLREDFYENVSDYINREDQAKYITGVILYALDRCDEAQPYLELFVERTPADPMLTSPSDGVSRNSASFYLGVCAIRREDYSQATTLFEPIAYNGGRSSKPTPTDAAINLAWLYLQDNRDAEAFAILNDYVMYYMGPLNIAIIPPNVERLDTLVMRAQFHALNADFDAALNDMQTAIRLMTEHDASPEMMADLYTTQGQIRLPTYEWDAVLEDYNTAIELAPNQAEAYYRRGLLYYTTLVDRENALPDFERYLELAPDGEFAADAAQYIADIQAELEALER